MPVPDDLAKRRQELSANKRSLLAKRLQSHEPQSLVPSSVVQRRAGLEAPLSFAQERLYFLQQLEPQSAAYHESIAVRITGTLHQEILEETVATLTGRHELFQTVLREDDGVIKQVIEPSLLVNHRLASVSIDETEPQARERALQWQIQHLIQRPFQMTEQLLWHATLLHVAPDDRVLLIVLHHLLCDAWSIDVFIQELHQLYTALVEQKTLLLPAQALRYGDYASAQRTWLQGAHYEQLLAYWKKQLAGCPPSLNLPTDFLRGAHTGQKAGYLPLSFSAQVTRQIHALAQQMGVTTFMILLSSLVVLLTRYCQQDEVVIGVPVSGRDHHDLKQVFGLFLNTIALRISVADRPTLAKLIQNVRQVTLDGYAHQEMPFEKLVEELHPQRLLTQSPLFQVMLDLQYRSEIERTRAEYQLIPLQLNNDYAKFDLSFGLREQEQTLSGQLTYNRDLWDQTTMQQLLTYWLTIIQSMATYLEQPVSSLPIWIPETGSSLSSRSFSPLVVQQVFEQQVHRSSTKVAVLAHEQSISYDDLNAYANQLAHYLVLHGLRPEQRVALCLERSLEAVIALFAILKAGGTYVPLDPQSPAERIAFQLQDCAATYLLTSPQQVLDFAGYGGKILPLALSSWMFSAYDQTNLQWSGFSQQLAYLVYTSGSTGQPKAVGVSHEAVMDHLSSVQSVFGIHSEDRVWQFASLAFDVSLEQIFTTLVSGATLILRSALWDAHDLTDYVKRSGLSVLNIPPSYWYEWITDEQVQNSLVAPSSLRLVILGGEKVRPEAVQLWHTTALRTVQLVNAYGPTEAIITSSVFDLTHWYATLHTDHLPVRTPIGHALPARRYLVLDEEGAPVPPGLVGELAIGGPLLARGYFQRPDLTAERFLPDPFTTEPGARLYRTGDRVRMLPTGALEFLDRCDAQVKIRGFRVELGEIEALLRSHPLVKEAVVIAQALDQEALCAYVTTLGEATQEELYQFLAGLLPGYMLPGRIIFLPTMPLTIQGKVDRAALPLPREVVAVVATNGFQAPETALQQALAELWKELLAVPQVGVADHFFKLGGHSLLAIRLISRIRRDLQVELPLLTIFDAPTLGAMAREIELLLPARLHDLSPVLSHPSTQVEHNQAHRLSFSQEHLWFLEQLHPNTGQYHLSFAYQVEGDFRFSLFTRALAEIVRRQECLRTVFRLEADGPRQIVLPALTIPIRQLSGLATQELEPYLTQEASQPFDLEQGPLFRVLWLELAPDRVLLQCTTHHSLFDGWSISVFLQELLSLYSAFSQERPSPLPELPCQYRQFAAWQRSLATGESYGHQLRYWQEHLAGAPPLLALPLDHARPAVLSVCGERVTYNLPVSLARQIRDRSQQEGVTLFVMLLAAFEILLARLSGQTDIVVGTIVAHRPRLEFEALIGLFANTLVLRTTLTGEPTFREVLARVRQTVLDAQAHQEVPFAHLVQALQPERSSGYHPLFQVEFGLLEDLIEQRRLMSSTRQLLDLTISPVPIAIETVKFDLSLFVEVHAEEMELVVEYATALFERSTILRLMGYFQTLLEQIVQAPEQKITNYTLLTANQPLTSPLPEETFLQAFSRQVDRTPGAIAVLADGQSLTYQEVQSHSDRVAQVLLQAGIQPEEPVALLAERNIAFLIMLLAIFKAGGVYLPLDPGLPGQRLHQILVQSQTRFVVAAHALCATVNAAFKELPLIPTLLEQETLLHDAASLLLSAHEQIELPALSSRQLAYIIYTSGSTGEPKGAMIEHLGMLNHLYAKVQDLALTAEDCVAQSASQCFDISLWQFLAALLVGGRIAILPDIITYDLSQLLQTIEVAQISIFETVPSLLQSMLQELARQEEGRWPLTSLRWLLLTGEALAPRLCADWFAYYPAIPLLNAYGPTECSDDVTHCRIEQPLPIQQFSVPLGRPVLNMELYLLDASLQLVPPGVIGEIYLGGVGVGRGYLHAADKTSAAFLPHPFSHQAGARLYKTGDLARYTAQGELEFLGRSDQQVKIHGFRIELGEIEHVLRRYTVIRDAVVLVRENRRREQRLVAFFSVQQSIDLQDLREFLQMHLPAYMIPGSFVLLEKLPLNANGKIDRHALMELPVPEESEYEQVILPRTALEAVLAELWSELLERPQISVYHNFFLLGGHSLLAIQLISRLNQIFQITCPVRHIFEAPTIAELAPVIQRYEARPGQLEKIALVFQQITQLSTDDVARLLDKRKRAEQESETAHG
ncbi:non-ribosomal peptide synthetase [Tengunoibacter tsumagoiensis]|uniref:Carrier domain-containing protein n=1 Tax=Tengunoibacter tsumagoiensis TaxID=2014871 RepID=A0A402A990_9CHLR|nr:non-ribosomal peptide synthetase [Tengunoibacter tsumagoiensis]GCE15668.1 hypothetical protein KTT_55270 [Tengunoibacter tsumagoiensis]